MEKLINPSTKRQTTLKLTTFHSEDRRPNHKTVDSEALKKSANSMQKGDTLLIMLTWALNSYVNNTIKKTQMPIDRLEQSTRLEHANFNILFF